MPSLAVLWAPGSIGPAAVWRAAKGLCEPVFVFDSRGADPAVAELLRVGPHLDVQLDSDLEVRLRKLGVSGVATFSETLIRRTAVLSETLGLPGHSRYTASLLTDKLLQRRRLNHATPEVRATELDAPRDIADAVARIGLPLVVKPTTGSGSRGVTLLRDPADVERWLIAAEGDAHPRRFLAEEFLAGTRTAEPWFADYASVESVVFCGEPFHFCISDRLPVVRGLRESCLSLPTGLPQPVRESLFETASRAIAALGITDGVLHTEIKLTDPPKVIEVNGRLGGGVGELLSRISDYDPVRAALKVALGREPDRFQPTYRGRGAWWVLHAGAEEGLVEEMPSVDDFLGVPGVWAARATHALPVRLARTSGVDDRLMDVFVERATSEELRQTFKWLAALERRVRVRAL